MKDAYGELIVKHEASREQIEDDTAFEQEELWLEDYQNAFLELETNTLDYIKLNVEKGKPELENEIENPSTDNKTKAKSKPHPHTTMDTKTTMEKLAKMRMKRLRMGLKPRQQISIIQQQQHRSPITM